MVLQCGSAIYHVPEQAAPDILQEFRRRKESMSPIFRLAWVENAFMFFFFLIFSFVFLLRFENIVFSMILSTILGLFSFLVEIFVFLRPCVEFIVNMSVSLCCQWFGGCVKSAQNLELFEIED